MKKILPLIAILALAGAGCGRPSKPAPSNTGSTPAATAPAGSPILDKRYDACALFVKADAEAVLGTKVNDPLTSGAATEGQVTTVSSCSYATSAELPNDVKVASLLVRKAATKAEADQVFTDARAQSKGLSGVDPVDIRGLGDRAYWSGGNLTQMNVLNGNAWLIINIQDTQSRNLQQQATEAVKRALDKMGKL